MDRESLVILDAGGGTAIQSPTGPAIRVDRCSTSTCLIAFVYIPGGTIHTVRHSGHGDGRMLTVSSPGGIEAMFMAPDAETSAAAERKLGAESVGPPLAPDS